MRTREEIIHLLRQALPGLRLRYGVATLSLFGSWARGDQTTTSDVDVAVTFDNPPDLWGYFELRDELADALGLRVDLVCRDHLRPLIRERVAREEMVL